MKRTTPPPRDACCDCGWKFTKHEIVNERPVYTVDPGSGKNVTWKELRCHPSCKERANAG